MCVELFLKLQLRQGKQKILLHDIFIILILQSRDLKPEIDTF